MTHEFALFVVDLLIADHGEAWPLFYAIKDSVTILPTHKDEFLRAFEKTPEITLGEAKTMLTPPDDRNEIVGHPCRNCGADPEQCEIKLTDLNFKEVEAWVCNRCSHQVILPKEESSEEDQ